MNSFDLVRSISLRLRDVSGDVSGFEAKQMLLAVLGRDGSAFASEVHLTEDASARLEQMILRRTSGEPLQYILGEWEFMGLPFRVREGVLIPRPETENLCECAVSLIRKKGYETVLDLCCGTGCIGISVGKITSAHVTCVDIDGGCAELTRENAARNGVTVTVRQGDLFDAVRGEKYDLICCNPPYLSTKDMENLQTEVRREPALALFGGTDGLEYYRRIAGNYPEHLNGNGSLLMEIGSEQAESVRNLFPGARVINDYAGLPRVVCVEGI